MRQEHRQRTSDIRQLRIMAAGSSDVEAIAHGGEPSPEERLSSSAAASVGTLDQTEKRHRFHPENGLNHARPKETPRPTTTPTARPEPSQQNSGLHGGGPLPFECTCEVKMSGKSWTSCRRSIFLPGESVRRSKVS